mmetsp:Transcript_27286/g.42655  ORF Transcript_27286/g.42655 Transcript_27286/m.42655 type:complete len:351 (-) Transcript_27286:673-1725(-)
MSPLSSSAPRLLGPSALALLVAALCPQESAGYLSSSAPQLFSSSAPQMLSSAARQPLRSSVLTLSSAAPQPSSSSAHQPFSRRTALAFTLVTAGFGAKEVLAEEAKEDFYTKWPFEKPSDVLPFVFANARKGHPEEILSALDEFGKYYPNYRLGSEKGDILESKLKEINPKNCLEIGTFWGYSAIRTARNLPEGGKLTCIEYNGNHANVARQLISYAGFSDKVELVLGKSSYMLPKVAKKIGQADYVLMDHIKPLYLPDLQLMEKLGVVGEGTVVSVDYPFPPGPHSVPQQNSNSDPVTMDPRTKILSSPDRLSLIPFEFSNRSVSDTINQTSLKFTSFVIISDPSHYHL